MSESEFNPPSNPREAPLRADVEQVQSELRKLERRDWWLWIVAVTVMLLLTVAVVSMNFPGLVKIDDPFFQTNLTQNVRGLIALVLLFNAYSIYQQFSIKRLRRQFSQQLQDMGTLQTQANEFHRLAATDPLTGLANRRTAEQRLTAETARSWRHGRPLTLAAFDLNHFKEINDQHGHPAGDQVLLEFARRLASAVRLSDLAVRMGGDEFLAVLPECRIDQVSSLVARLRPMEVTLPGGLKIPVEFSVGSVSLESGETPEQFLERADQTLYADKRAGKMRDTQPVLR